MIISDHSTEKQVLSQFRPMWDVGRTSIKVSCIDLVQICVPFTKCIDKDTIRQLRNFTKYS